MHMKYFQAIADIKNHYKEILHRLDNLNKDKWGHFFLEGLEINPTEKDDIIEEYEVLRYLIGCQQSLVRGLNAKKPSIEAVQRCFNRQLFILEKIHHCNAYNVNKHSCKITQKEYKACRHYLFKFSQIAWYNKLPEEILSFENKYPEF